MYLADYSVNQDGENIPFQVGVAGSMGYTRGFKDNGGRVRPHYLTFYSTFGGFNSTICVDYEYDLKLNPEDKEVAELFDFLQIKYKRPCMESTIPGLY